MWEYGQMQTRMRAGFEKHQSYLREAETARMLGSISWRARAAGVIRSWADRLEPSAPQDSYRPALKRAH